MFRARGNITREEVARFIGPAINGVIFHKCSTDLDSCRGSILSLIWLPLQPGTDLNNRARGSARLWQAALDYIHKLPGCECLLWGYALGTESAMADNPFVLLLIQWNTVSAWKTFQESAGVHVMNSANLIRGHPLNLTIRQESGANWIDLADRKAIEIS